MVEKKAIAVIDGDGEVLNRAGTLKKNRAGTPDGGSAHPSPLIYSDLKAAEGSDWQRNAHLDALVPKKLKNFETLKQGHGPTSNLAGPRCSLGGIEGQAANDFLSGFVRGASRSSLHLCTLSINRLCHLPTLLLGGGDPGRR